jgi:hypothetical protein
MVRITLEYNTAEEAIVALAKLGDIESPVKNAAPAPVREEGQQEHTAPAASAPEAAPRSRKPRADAGKTRGPRKVNAAPAAATAVADVAPVPAAAPKPTAPASAPAEGDGPAAVDPKDVQAAIEQLYAAKQADVTMAALARFGVSRGRDLKPEQRAEFIKYVQQIIAGTADPIASAA